MSPTNPIDRNSRMLGFIQGLFAAHAAPLNEIPRPVRRRLLFLYELLPDDFVNAVLADGRMSDRQTLTRMQTLARIEAACKM